MIATKNFAIFLFVLSCYKINCMNNAEQTTTNFTSLNSLKEKCYQYIATNATKIDAQKLLTFNHTDLKEKIWRRIKQHVLYPVTLDLKLPPTKYNDFVLSTLCLTQKGNIVGGINTLRINNNKAYDIKVWNFYGKLLQRLKGHINIITSLCTKHETDHELLISASYDHSIKIWNLNKSKCLRTLKIHNNHAVGGAILYNNDIISSDYSTTYHDATIQITDLTTEQPKQQFKLSKSPTNQLQLSLHGNNNIIIAGSGYQGLTMFDTTSQKIIGYFPDGFTSCSTIDDKILVAENYRDGYLDSFKLKLYDQASYQKELKSKNMQASGMTKLSICDNKIGVGFENGTIVVLDQELTQEFMFFNPAYYSYRPIHSLCSYNDEYLIAGANDHDDEAPAQVARLHINKKISNYEILDLAHQGEKNPKVRQDWWYQQ